MNNQWFPVVTLVLGSALALTSTLLTQSIKARQDRVATRDQMEAESSRLSLEELRQLLAELQDAFEQFVEAIHGVAESLYADDAQQQPTQEQQQLAEEKLRAAHLHCVLILSRLPDDTWIKQANGLIDSAITQLHNARSAEEAGKVTELAWKNCSELLLATGEPFREYYRGGLKLVRHPGADNG
jgi:hypothetical protein